MSYGVYLFTPFRGGSRGTSNGVSINILDFRRDKIFFRVRGKIFRKSLVLATLCEKNVFFLCITELLEKNNTPLPPSDAATGLDLRIRQVHLRGTIASSAKLLFLKLTFSIRVEQTSTTQQPC